MNERAQILSSVRSNKPRPVPLPSIRSRPDKAGLLEQFRTMAEGAGSSVERLDSAREIAKWVQAQTGFGGEIFDLYSDSGHDTLQRIIEHTFIDEDKVVLGCTLGVAENGAVWVDNEMLKSRKIPFVAGHLVFVLRSDRIVADMHEAYTRIDLGTTGFGVFIAGPSKTADIEQSLVIGAHGPVKNTVVLY